MCLLVLPFYVFLLNFNLFYGNAPDLQWQVNAPIYGWIVQVLASVPPLLLRILFVVCILLQSLWLDAVVNRYQLTENPQHLTAICTAGFLSLFNEHLYWSAPFIANFFIIAAIDHIFHGYDTHTSSEPFDAAFALGIASLIYLPLGLLLLFALIAFQVLRIFRWRQWVLFAAGAFAPYFLLACVCFWCDSLLLFFPTHFYTSASSITHPSIGLSELVIEVVLVFFVLLSVLSLIQAEYFKSAVRVRKLLTILIYLLALSIALFAFSDTFSLAILAPALLTLSILAAYVLYRSQKKHLLEILHVFVLVLVFVVQYYIQ